MEKLFLDRRFLVNGKKSHINLDNFVALHDYIIDVITALQPYTFQSGLTESPALTVEWGGDLLRNTTINGTSNYNVAFNNLTGFSVKSLTNNITFTATSGNINCEASAIMDIEGGTFLRIGTPNVASKLQGAILQQITNGSGNCEYTSYGLPLIDGSNGDTLITDGLGNVYWSPASTIVGAENGTQIVSSNVRLGGSLITDTVVTGNSNFNLSLEDNNILNLQSLISFNLKTPDYLTSSNGSLLQLQSNLTGQVEYTSYSLPISTSPAINDVLISTNTNEYTHQPQKQIVILEVADRTVELSTIIGTQAGEKWFGLSPYLEGWKLEYVTLQCFNTGPQFQFQIFSGVSGTTNLLTDFFTGSVQHYPIITPYTITNLDAIWFRTAATVGGGIGMFGMSITLTFTSS